MKPLDHLLRKHILHVKPYSSARSEYPSAEGNAQQSGGKTIFLDANENSFGSPMAMGVNRYPDPLQIAIKQRIAAIKQIPESSINTIFLGNGSDEPIDLLIRAFCEPGHLESGIEGDDIIITPPTYGMYEVSASIHNVRVLRVPLLKTAERFILRAESVLESVTPRTKLIFLCSPNNPTGNLLERDQIERLLKEFDGIVVLDEAYIDFSMEHSFLPQLHQYPNCVILQTFSKAWGMAGMRLGMAFADKSIINVLNTIKPPYNINVLTQQAALKALSNAGLVWQRDSVAAALRERERLSIELSVLACVVRVYPSDANFLLVAMQDAAAAYSHLVRRGIIVRDRSRVALCEECLRITVGTADENTQLIEALQEL